MILSKKMITTTIALSALFLSSCATTNSNNKIDPNYQAYLQTIQNYHPKIVEIEAQPGQTIELKGVQKFVVYAPSGSAGSSIRVYRPAPDPWVMITHDVLHTGLTAATTVLPKYYAWKYGSSVIKTAIHNSGTHVNGDYISNGDKVGQDKYTVSGDYVTGTKAGQDYVGQDKNNPGQDYVGQSKYNPGQDYVGQDKNTVTGDYVTGTKDSYNTPKDNSTTP